MSDPTDAPLALAATDVPSQQGSGYPAPFADRVMARSRRRLGDVFGVSNFGVNMTELPPGSESALLHRHSKQDEFIYILEGTPTLRTDQGEVEMKPGDCAGFPAGGVAHHLVNRSDAAVVYLEVGDRRPGDSGSYPEDDLAAVAKPEGGYRFTHKDGSDY